MSAFQHWRRRAGLHRWAWGWPGLSLAGKAVLLVSVELDEILSLSDRILVMFNGEMMGEISAEEADERKIGLLMAGIREEAA